METKDESVIPKGMYCYEIENINVVNGHIRKRNCPYWSTDGENGACSFLGLDDKIDSTMLWDQLKECNINIGD